MSPVRLWRDGYGRRAGRQYPENPTRPPALPTGRGRLLKGRNPPEVIKVEAHHTARGFGRRVDTEQ
jgi:hypothetical protein